MARAVENVMTEPDTVMSSPEPQSMYTPSTNTIVVDVVGVNPVTVMVVTALAVTSSYLEIVMVGALAAAAMVMVLLLRVSVMPLPCASVMVPPLLESVIVRSLPVPSPAVTVCNSLDTLPSTSVLVMVKLG